METAKPDWLKVKPEEMEILITGLAKEGKRPAQIGLILRDQHGIPKAKLLGKRILNTVKNAGISTKTESQHLKEKIKNLESHIGKNKHDSSAKRSLGKKRWQVAKLKN